MNKATGFLAALRHEYGEPVNYFLNLNGISVSMNDLLGKTIQIRFHGEMVCIYCGRPIKKNYGNNSCFKCFKELPDNDLCIVKPSLCHFERGTCRDPRFGETHCMQPHIVYLALSSDVKVGITRKNHMVKRWIDQGAVRAMPILEVPSRHLAGLIEAHLSQFLTDRTDWRKMLKNVAADRDLPEVREEVHAHIPDEYLPYWLDKAEVTEIRYPELEPPAKVVSLQLEKRPEIEGRLTGIKGQYLILDCGVINIRKHAGYKVELTVIEDPH